MSDRRIMEALLALHRVDADIEKLKSQKELLPVSLSRVRTRLERQTQSLESKRDDLKALRADTHATEVLLKGAEEEAEKLRGQLNTASTNREYNALQHEIADKMADASRIEDQVLAGMADIEALEEEINTLEQAIAQIKHEHDQEASGIEKDMKGLDGKIQALQDSRAAAAAKVDAEMLEEYERIAAKKGATALAAVVGDACQGCFMHLTPQLCHVLKAGNRIVHCPNCSRLLYMP
jgi:predicted  nucleic acid-binding Zn-ribbon protein